MLKLSAFNAQGLSVIITVVQNSAFNAQGLSVTIVVVQVGSVKALREKERHHKP
jgi:hypothetical protein